MQTHNKSALITGASRGIGRAAAIAFAQAGYDLFLTCHRSLDELEALALTLQETCAVRCQAIPADMGCEADVAQLFEKISCLDVLVNNAGMAHLGLLTDMTSEQWHRILSVNLDSCFYTCRAAIPLMLSKHRGKIINISSVWGAQGASMEVAYSASKGGMNAFTRALAKELAPQQHSGKRRCLRRHRHLYERLPVGGGTGVAAAGNPGRPAGNAGGGGAAYPAACQCPVLSDRSDYNDGRRMVLSTSAVLFRPHRKNLL